DERTPLRHRRRRQRGAQRNYSHGAILLRPTIGHLRWLGPAALEVGEPAVFPVEEQLDGADRPVTVLGNHDLGDVLFFGLRAIVVLPVDEEDEIGYLLQPPRIMDNKPICDKVMRARHNKIVNRVASSWEQS